MLTLTHQDGSELSDPPTAPSVPAAASSGRGKAVPRDYPEPADGERPVAATVDLDRAPVVSVPVTVGELAERLGELIDEATDPEAWEAVLAGAAQFAGDRDLGSSMAPLVGRAREALGRGEAGVWYLDPEYDAARLTLSLAGRSVARRAPTWGWPDHRRHRVDEVLDIVDGRRPSTLIATPTGPGGTLDPEVYADRLARCTDSRSTDSASVNPRSVNPRTVDEHQARLRLSAQRGVAAEWAVRAERGRQGAVLTLTEVAEPALARIPAARDRLTWHGMANPVPAGSQRVPSREADLLRWASPHEADRFDAWAAERLARNIDWWEADWDERRLFTRLRTTPTAPGLPGRVLLAIGLATKQASAHQPAVAVTRRLLDAGLLGPRRFAQTMADVAPILEPARLARTMGALRSTHAYAVATILSEVLPAFAPTQRGMAPLIAVYADIVETTGWSAASVALPAWLDAAARIGGTALEAQRAAVAIAAP